MADHKRFKVPLPTRHSFGIEIECLVAWLPPKRKDPYESEVQGLPPVLRVESGQSPLQNHIRDLLTANGVPVIDPREDDSASEVSASGEPIPERLKGKDKWELCWDPSVTEKFVRDYRYQGIELKSPAFWATDEAFEEIKFVVSLLKANLRCKINPTCGLHVHVGNGKQYFPATTIRRLGTFLWAADQTLSRLHAPYRSVHGYCPSIRHQTSLACGLTAIGVEDEYQEWMRDFDPLRIAEFSDTTREEIDYGGKEKWEEYVRSRKDAGPYMTLDDYIEIEPINDSDDDSSEPPFLSKTEEELRKGWHQRLKDYNGRDIPPDMNTLHRNIGWVRWDTLGNPKLIELLHFYCNELYGHTELEILPNEQQVDLMIRSQSYILYGHSNREQLAGPELYAVLMASARFLEAARSCWKWNSDLQRFIFDWTQGGDLLEHPLPAHDASIDAPGAIHRMENLAQLTELEGDHHQEGIEYISREAYEEAIDTNTGLEALLNELKNYQPAPDPQFREALPSPVGEFSSEEEFTTPSEPASSASSAYMARAWEAIQQTIEEGSPEHVNPPERKLRPHQFSKYRHLPEYQKQINKYLDLDDYMWDRIGWLPSLSHPIEDPAAGRMHDWAGRLLEPTTATLEGLFEISSCQSAMAVAMLLKGPDDVRANYNFNKYIDHFLLDDQGQNWNSENSRTIEFREAGGSLDADWIEMWARICVGIVGYARDTMARDFFDMLFVLFEQEERDFRIEALEARSNLNIEELVDLSEEEERRFDVIDMLFEMGLYGEAAWCATNEEYYGVPM